MKTRRLFLISVVFLAIGVWLIAYYCSGDAGLQAGDHIAAFSIKLDITTIGYPAIFGVPAVLAGSALLLIATIAALVAEIRAIRSRKKLPEPRIENAPIP